MVVIYLRFYLSNNLYDYLIDENENESFLPAHNVAHKFRFSFSVMNMRHSVSTNSTSVMSWGLELSKEHVAIVGTMKSIECQFMIDCLVFTWRLHVSLSECICNVRK